MVHIPIFGIDVPEPSIAQLVPGSLDVFIMMLSKARHGLQRGLYPLSPKQQVEELKEYVDSFPREFDSVFEKTLSGKIQNDDQLSSEMEDASYAWYRRMIRTGAVGNSEEDQEDVTAAKLGLTKASAQKQVWESYKVEQERIMDEMYSHTSGPSTVIPLRLVKGEGEDDVYVPEPGTAAPDIPKAMNPHAAWVQAQDERDRQFKAAVAEAEEMHDWEMARLEADMCGSGKTIALTSISAGLGAGLGLLVFRGVALAWKHTMKYFSKGRRRAQKEKKKIEAAVAARAQRTGVASPTAASKKPAVSATTRERGAVKATAAGKEKASSKEAASKSGSSKTATSTKTSAATPKSSARVGARKR